MFGIKRNENGKLIATRKNLMTTLLVALCAATFSAGVRSQMYADAGEPGARAGTLTITLVGLLIGALLVVIIGTSLIPTIQNQTNSSHNALLDKTGKSTAGSALSDLIPLFYVLVLVIGIVAAVFVVMKHL